MKKAIITGITGQDGAYLAQLLLQQGYSESYDIFATSGILISHESPLCGKEFVTRKISDSVAKIKRGLLDTLELGNLDAHRDWGFARDYVQGMHQMLQAEQADTFVLATGQTQTIRDFVNMSFEAVDISLEWIGSALQECAKDSRNGQIVVCVNPRFLRPAEADLLIGDAAKAKTQLGWSPGTNLEELCQMMVTEDLRCNEQGRSY